MTKQQSYLYLLHQYAAYLQDEKMLAAATRRAYLHVAERFITECGQRAEALLLPQPWDWDWQRVDKRAVEIYLRRRRDERGWRRRTVAQQASALRAWFAFLQSRGIVWRNPARNLELGVTSAPPPLPEGEVSAVQELFAVPPTNLDAARLQLSLELLYGAGLRPSQLYAVSAISADASAGMVEVISRGRTLRLPLGAGGLERLRRYRAFRDGAVGGGADAPFWVDRRGRACSPQRLARAVRRALESAGLEPRPSLLRRLGARHFREHGGDVRSLQQFMGSPRLGAVDALAQLDYSAVLERFRAAHPRNTRAGPPRADPAP